MKICALNVKRDTIWATKRKIVLQIQLEYNSVTNMSLFQCANTALIIDTSIKQSVFVKKCLLLLIIVSITLLRLCVLSVKTTFSY